MSKKNTIEIEKDNIARRTQHTRKITEEYLRELARLCAYSGKTFSELSEELGYEREYIYTLRRRRPELIEYTDEAIREKFREMSSAGLETTLELMNTAESERVRLQAAKEILSRAGYDAVQRVENTNKEITVELFEDEEE